MRRSLRLAVGTVAFVTAVLAASIFAGASLAVVNATGLTATGPATDATATLIAASTIGSVLSFGTTSPAATGTVSFSVYGPSATAPTTCQTTSGGSWTAVGTAPVNGNGTYKPAAGFNPAAAGTYWWYAAYGGDILNGVSNSLCNSASMASTVVKNTAALTATGPATDATATLIAASAIGSALSGGTMSPAETGTVSFSVYGPSATAPTTCQTTGGGFWTAVGAGTTVNAGNGTYNPTAGFTPATAGTYWWYAAYSGDANNLAATSICSWRMSTTVVSASGTGQGQGGPGCHFTRRSHRHHRYWVKACVVAPNPGPGLGHGGDGDSDDVGFGEDGGNSGFSNGKGASSTSSFGGASGSKSSFGGSSTGQLGGGSKSLGGAPRLGGGGDD